MLIIVFPQQPPAADCTEGSSQNVVTGLTADIKISFLQTYTSLSMWTFSTHSAIKNIFKTHFHCYTSIKSSLFLSLVLSSFTCRCLGLAWMYVTYTAVVCLPNITPSLHPQKKKYICLKTPYLNLFKGKIFSLKWHEFLDSLQIQDCKTHQRWENTRLWWVRAWERRVAFYFGPQ